MLRWRTVADSCQQLTHCPMDGTTWNVTSITKGMVHWHKREASAHMNHNIERSPENVNVRRVLLSLQKYNWMFIDPITPKRLGEWIDMPLVKEDSR